MRTLLQRMGTFNRVSGFARMGSAEYEQGAPRAALDLMACNVGAPHAAVPTSIVIRPRDVSQFRTKEGDIPEKFAAMADGVPLKMRIIPVLCKEDELVRFATHKSLQDVHNKGAVLCEDTEFWVMLSPVVGILYHPSQEARVKAHLEETRARLTEETTNPNALAVKVLEAVKADPHCKADKFAVLDLIDEARARQAPLRRIMDKITGRSAQIDVTPW